jgi:hypothetical protein
MLDIVNVILSEHLLETQKPYLSIENGNADQVLVSAGYAGSMTISSHLHITYQVTIRTMNWQGKSNRMLVVVNIVHE